MNESEISAKLYDNDLTLRIAISITHNRIIFNKNYLFF
jgi:hypothetical protein